jgi:hypothetical protein
MKVYTIIVQEDPGNPWVAAARVEVTGSTVAGLPLTDARGLGSGPDPAEAAHDAMISAECALEPPLVTAARNAKHVGYHD